MESGGKRVRQNGMRAAATDLLVSAGNALQGRRMANPARSKAAVIVVTWPTAATSRLIRPEKIWPG
jgi:hypothetical protein